MKNNIKVEFICDKELYGVIPEPKPAAKMLPKWFRSMSEFTSEGNLTPGYYESLYSFEGCNV